MKIHPVTGGKSQIELDKRQHVPALVEDDCPKCGTTERMDLSHGGGDLGRYLSYPMVNTPHDQSFCCSKCEHEWSRRVIVRMSLEAV